MNSPRSRWNSSLVWSIHCPGPSGSTSAARLGLRHRRTGSNISASRSRCTTAQRLNHWRLPPSRRRSGTLVDTWDGRWTSPARFRRFVDITVDVAGETRKLSLKSTAARDLSEATVHISKLTEAAWIQDARTPSARRIAMLDLFQQYREAVSAILMLRAFRTDAGTPPQRYQLVEIPVRLFDSIHESSLRDFERDAPVIACQVDGETVAHVAVDRSDAKITVRRIQLSACVVHAEWRQV